MVVFAKWKLSLKKSVLKAFREVGFFGELAGAIWSLKNRKKSSSGKISFFLVFSQDQKMKKREKL